MLLLLTVGTLGKQPEPTIYPFNEPVVYWWVGNSLVSNFLKVATRSWRLATSAQGGLLVSGKDHLQKPCVDRTTQQMYNSQVLGVDSLGLNLDEATGDRYFVPGFHWYMEKKIC